MGSSAFEGVPIRYTVRAEQRAGLLEAVETLDPGRFEVVLYATGDLSNVTLLTQDREGLARALNDVAPEWSHAVVRVYAEQRDNYDGAGGGGA